MNSLWTTSVVAAVAFVLAPLASPASAGAGEVPAPTADTAQSQVTWSVRPGGAGGPDGRAWVEWEAGPGEQRAEHLVVTNYGPREVQFRLSAADGYFTDTGRFTMLPSDRGSSDAGTWISLPPTVTVAAGASQVVPFTIQIPPDATPGDHPAGVAAGIHSPGTDTVAVESRVGFRVMTRVTGELRTGLAATVTGAFDGGINPFEPGRIDVAYEVTNTGNTRVRTEPRIVVVGPSGVVAERPGAVIAEMAPGESRTGSVRISAVWPLFRYDVRIEAAPLAVSDEVGVPDASAVSARSAVVAFPWSQLTALMVALLLAAWYLGHARRSRLRTARLVEAARAQGRAEASGEVSSSDLSAPAGGARR